MRRAGVGIHIMDRGYLDFCAFSKTYAENVKKIDELRERVHAVCGNLEAGHILFIKASEEVLSQRQARRGKLRGKQRNQIDYNGAELAEQSRILETTYRPTEKSIFDTSNEFLRTYGSTNC